jgi:PIN domain nuclease of toxin-antitoxin system
VGSLPKKLLLDTHALVWALFEPDRLPDRVRQSLLCSDSVLVVSPASIWQVGIKHHLGKLAGVEPLLTDVDGALQHMQALTLPINLNHVCKAASWKSQHRDPFDRMLAAQAPVKKLTLVSADTKLAEFPVEVRW